MRTAVEDFIEKTWEQVGLRVIKPLRKTVFVRTKPRDQKIGNVWLPQSATTFYEGMAHQRLVVAMVLIAGKESVLKPGDAICFARLHFARLGELEDKSMVGWVDESQVAGYYDD